MYIILVIFHILHVCDAVNYIYPVEVEASVNDRSRRVNSTLYRTVKKYYCAARDVDDSYLLVYGSKGWTFAPQDVNITLSYPTTAQFTRDLWEEFIIIGFKVNLYLDGSETTGYISDGGLYNNFISLTFLCSNISTLSYQFWLYGIPKSVHSTTPVINNTNNKLTIC
ncbi:uncharacterized protein LOC115455956 [Manduca sexta]|uniref:uncharacterized protein LOC115455956 n=1 Tax=Manduca sexta TaxID=7130 RepID=UPI00188F5195|nr:uncharacterized protein LOC115455956 [Manduca sexta]